MTELLHQIYLLQKPLHILFIGAGESLDSHWKSSLVPCYILKQQQSKEVNLPVSMNNHNSIMGLLDFKMAAPINVLVFTWQLYHWESNSSV